MSTVIIGLCMTDENFKIETTLLHSRNTGIAIPLRPFGDRLQHALRMARPVAAIKFRPGFRNGFRRREA